jgi:hypothetical protein
MSSKSNSGSNSGSSSSIDNSTREAVVIVMQVQ